MSIYCLWQWDYVMGSVCLFVVCLCFSSEQDCSKSATQFSRNPVGLWTTDYCHGKNPFKILGWWYKYKMAERLALAAILDSHCNVTYFHLVQYGGATWQMPIWSAMLKHRGCDCSCFIYASLRFLAGCRKRRLNQGFVVYNVYLVCFVTITWYHFCWLAAYKN